MRKSVMITTIVFLLMTLACVTVNVYFPAAEVQSAADQIVEEIHGTAPQSSNSDAVPSEGMLQRTWRELSPFEGYAYAQADINVTTPNIRALKQSMKERFSSLRPLYQEGIIGEGNDGLLNIRSLDALDLKGKADAKKLVEAENKDRKKLYVEIAEANDLPPDTVDEITGLFANSWRKDAEKGWWIQKNDGAWVKKE